MGVFEQHEKIDFFSRSLMLEMMPLSAHGGAYSSIDTPLRT
jgi:hypothetical protein